MDPITTLTTPGQSVEAIIAACEALAGTDDARAVLAMLSVMQGFGPIHDAVGAALRSTPIARPLLMGWLAAPTPDADDWAVACALAQLGLDDPAVDAMLRTLWRCDPRLDPTAVAAQTAARALGSHGDTRVVPHLVALGNAILQGRHRIGYPERLLGALTGALAELEDPRGLPLVMAWFAQVTEGGNRDYELADEFCRLVIATVESQDAPPPELLAVLPTIEALCRRGDPSAVELLMHLARSSSNAVGRLRAMVREGDLSEETLRERAEVSWQSAWEAGVVSFLDLWQRWPAVVYDVLDQGLERQLRDAPPTGPAPAGFGEALIAALTVHPDACSLIDLIEHLPDAIPPLRDRLEDIHTARGEDPQISLLLSLVRAGVRDERLVRHAVRLLASEDGEIRDYAADILVRFEPLPEAARQAMATHIDPDIRAKLAPIMRAPHGQSVREDTSA